MIEQFLTTLLRIPGVPDLLIVGLGLAAYLIIASRNLRCPWNDRVRACSIVLAAFCLGNLMLGIIFGMDLRFKMLQAAMTQDSDMAKSQKAGTTPESARKNLLKEVSPEHGPSARSKERGTKEEFPLNKWLQIAHWEGNNPQKTKVFHIPSGHWMIYWHTTPMVNKPNILTVKLFRANGEFVRNITNIAGLDKGSIVIQDSGNYYLSIDASIIYNIFILLKK